MPPPRVPTTPPGSPKGAAPGPPQSKKRQRAPSPGKKKARRKKATITRSPDAGRDARRKSADAKRATQLAARTADVDARQAQLQKDRKAWEAAARRAQQHKVRRQLRRAAAARAKQGFKGAFKGFIQGAPTFDEKRLYKTAQADVTAASLRFFIGQVALPIMKEMGKRAGVDYTTDHDRREELANDIQYRISQLRQDWLPGTVDGAILKVMNGLSADWAREDVKKRAHADIAPGAQNLTRDGDGDVDLTAPNTPRGRIQIPVERSPSRLVIPRVQYKSTYATYGDYTNIVNSLKKSYAKAYSPKPAEQALAMRALAWNSQNKKIASGSLQKAGGIYGKGLTYADQTAGRMKIWATKFIQLLRMNAGEGRHSKKFDKRITAGDYPARFNQNWIIHTICYNAS